jgi:hypothetical protein
MSPRQARRERREAERKSRTAELKRAKAAVAVAPHLMAAPETADPEPEQEFSPQFLAHARSVRDRIERRVSAEGSSAARVVSHTPHSSPSHMPSRAREQAAPDAGFVSQNASTSKPSRAEINRQNAQYSTGPRTRDGKLAASRNSLKHGLASGTLLIPGEDAAAFEALRDALLGEHQPATETEELLTEEMAQSFWLSQRAIRLQNECFTPDGVDQKQLSLFLRYQTTHERAFYKALNTLLRLKQSRSREQTVSKSGFVSQPAHSPMSPAHPPGVPIQHPEHSDTLPHGFVSQNPTLAGHQHAENSRKQIA